MNKCCIFLFFIMIIFSGCSKDQGSEIPGKSAYGYLHLGAVKPKGWLQNVIKTEVDGATGHMHEFTGQISRKPFIIRNIIGWTVL